GRARADRVGGPVARTARIEAVAAMRAERTARTYRLEPLDSAGVVLGLGVLRCGLRGGGVVLGVAARTIGRRLPAAAVPVVASVLVSFTRIGGHATWEWLPLVVGWFLSGFRRGRRWHAPLPLWTDGDDPAPMPPCLDGIDIGDLDWRAGSRLGAFLAKNGRSRTTRLPVSARQSGVPPRARR